MNALSPIRAAAATQMHSHTYAAWRILSNGLSQRIEIDGTSLADASAAAACQCAHKDTFVVHETDVLRGEATAHFFAVKREAQGQWRTVNGVPTKVHNLYAAPLFSMKVAAFEPVEPWRVVAGADVLGADRETVNA